MNKKILASAFCVFLLGAGSVMAADGSVIILSPANGATVGQRDSVNLQYKAIPGSEGDHLHLNVDGKRVDVIHPMEGEVSAGVLPPGNHHICLAVNTKGHVPTGVEGCVDINSK
jgi:hypothetical protein